MAIAAALVGARGVGASTTATTTAGTTTASGSTFVICASFDAGYGSITVCNDNKSNVYTAQGTPVSDGAGGLVQLFVCQNGAGGSSHTATFTTNNASYMVVHLIEITGAETASLDKIAQQYDTSSPFEATSATLSQADELVLSICGANNGSSTSYASSNSTILSSETNVSSYWTSAVGYYIVAATTAVTPSWTRSSHSQGGLALATFKQSSGGGGGATRGMPFGPGTAFNGGRTFRGIVC